MKSDDILYLRNLVRENSAIVIEVGKEYLFETRLAPLIRQEGINSLEALVDKIRSEPYNGLHQNVVEAMTINETSFFRDAHPFESIRTVLLPELIANRSKLRKLNIWSAACSSGQEPYSLAMMIREHFPEIRDWEINIVATDISTQILERAKSGIYNQFEANRGLPATYLVKYFEEIGSDWRIRGELRQMIRFTPMNLAGTWLPMPSMDLILLRNVMIYFDMETKREILRKIRYLIKPDGTLFLGGAETTRQIDNDYGMIRVGKSICYRPVR